MYICILIITLQFLYEFGVLVKLCDKPCDIWRKWGPKVMELACQEKKCHQELQSCENEGICLVMHDSMYVHGESYVLQAACMYTFKIL